MKYHANIFANFGVDTNDLFLVNSSARAVFEGRSIRGQLEVLHTTEDGAASKAFESALGQRLVAQGLLVTVYQASSLDQFLMEGRRVHLYDWVSVADTTRRGGVKHDFDTSAPTECLPAALMNLAIRFSESGECFEAERVANHRDLATRILSVSRQHIFCALNQVLLSRFPDRGLRFLDQVGALAFLLPEVSLLKDFHLSSRHHHKDVYEHTLKVLCQSVPKPTVRWAALLHDIGKLHTRSYSQNGQVHFFKHDELGAYLCDGIFHRLQFPGWLAERIRILVLLHLRPGLYRPEWSDNAVRRLMREAGEGMADLIALARADNTTKRMSKRLANLRNVKALNDRCVALNTQRSNIGSKLPRGLGNAIKVHFELEQGPRIGEMVKMCHQGVVDGKLAPDAPTAVHLAFLRNEISQ